jgi:hypothetical protein
MTPDGYPVPGDQHPAVAKFFFRDGLIPIIQSGVRTMDSVAVWLTSSVSTLSPGFKILLILIFLADLAFYLWLLWALDREAFEKPTTQAGNQA